MVKLIKNESFGWIAEEYFKNFFYRLERSSSMNTRSIHKFRVSIKKIISLKEVLEASNTHPILDNKLNQIINELYLPAGELRSTQLNLASLNDIGSLKYKSYHEHLHKKQTKSKEKLKSALVDFNKTNFLKATINLKHVLESLNAEEIFDTCTKILQNKFVEIKSLYGSGLKKKNAHEIRKQLKHMLTAATIGKKISRSYRPANTFKRLKHVESEIGEWHNMHVLIKSLKRFSSEVDKVKERNTIDQLIYQMKIDQKISLNRLDNTVRDLIQNLSDNNDMQLFTKQKL